MPSLQKSRFNDITFERLRAMEGVNGAILTQSGRKVQSQTTLGEPQATQLAQLARSLCRGYRKVRRVPTKILMAYEKSAILVISRDDAQLVLLLESSVDIDTIGSAGLAYLTKRTQRPIRLPSPKRPAA